MRPKCKNCVENAKMTVFPCSFDNLSLLCRYYVSIDRQGAYMDKMLLKILALYAKNDLPLQRQNKTMTFH